VRGEADHELSWAGNRIAYVDGRNFHGTASAVEQELRAIIGVVPQRARDCISLVNGDGEIVVTFGDFCLPNLCKRGLCFMRKIRVERLPDIFVLAVGEVR